MTEVTRNYYMVRAMWSEEKDFKIFLENNVVAVGWSKLDFSKETVKELRSKLFELYYKEATWKPTVSKGLNEAERFKRINKGDYIIVPYNSSVLLAVADEKEIYSETAKDRDLANQRAVAYKYHKGELLVIPRNDLSEGLQRRLRVRGNSVSNLFEFKDEIERLFKNPSYSYTRMVQEFEEDALEKLKKGLLDNIQYGKTNLQTGGIGFENLICEIMRCEGYTAKVLAKNKFDGGTDADILATKEDSFMSKSIFIQAKHHSGISNRDGINQLIGVLKKDEYKECDGYFVTSARVDEDVRAYAEENGIEVIEGSEVVDLIISNITKLSIDLRYKLGMCMVPQLFNS